MQHTEVYPALRIFERRKVRRMGCLLPNSNANHSMSRGSLVRCKRLTTIAIAMASSLHRPVLPNVSLTNCCVFCMNAQRPHRPHIPSTTMPSYSPPCLLKTTRVVDCYICISIVDFYDRAQMPCSPPAALLSLLLYCSAGVFCS